MERRQRAGRARELHHLHTFAQLRQPLLVLHGGADNAFATNYGDSWTWDGSTWVAVAGASPTGRHGAGLAFDAQRGQMLRAGACRRMLADLRLRVFDFDFFFLGTAMVTPDNSEGGCPRQTS